MEVDESDQSELLSARGEDTDSEAGALDLQDTEAVDSFFFSDAAADSDSAREAERIQLWNPLYKSAPPPVYPFRRDHPQAQLELMRFPRRRDGILHVLAWNMEGGVGEDRDQFGSLIRWRQPEVLLLQETSRRSIPPGFVVPKELISLAKKAGQPFPRACVAIKDELESFVESCSYKGAPHKGYLARVGIACGDVTVHFVSVHAPTHDKNEEVWDSYVDGFQDTLNDNSLSDDVVVAGGDWNFCTNGALGYSDRRAESWSLVDAHRWATLVEKGFLPPNGSLPLTRREPRTGHMAGYDFFLVRGSDPVGVTKHAWDRMHSDHAVIETKVELPVPVRANDAIETRRGIPRKAKADAEPEDRAKFESCCDDFAAAILQVDKDLLANDPGSYLNELIEAGARSLEGHAKTRPALRSRDSIRTEIYRLRSWALVADALHEE
eukprot:gene18453-2763_t